MRILGLNYKYAYKQYKYRRKNLFYMIIILLSAIRNMYHLQKLLTTMKILKCLFKLYHINSCKYYHFIQQTNFKSNSNTIKICLCPFWSLFTIFMDSNLNKLMVFILKNDIVEKILKNDLSLKLIRQHIIIFTNSLKRPLKKNP